MTKVRLFCAILCLAAVAPAQADEPLPLQLEAKISLGSVSGRIDHFAIDLARQRLFVAELGNNSVGVVDLASGRTIAAIANLASPQGVGYVARTDTLFVANASDGSVRLFKGADLTPDGRIDLGGDADNVRIDVTANRVFVGYGDGGLAIIDAEKRAKIGEIPLAGHPESFEIDGAAGRGYINVPEAGQIAVLDMATGKQAAAWALSARGNYPMAFDAANQLVYAAFRDPPRLMSFHTATGEVAGRLATCSDPDDVFIDAKRQRIYVSCGIGYIDVFESRGSGMVLIAEVPTVLGARTSFLVPELDRLFLAVRAVGTEPAAVWVYTLQP